MMNLIKILSNWIDYEIGLNVFDGRIGINLEAGDLS
jgi:hypothetical protein